MAISSLLCSLLLVASPTLDLRVDGQGLLRFVRDGRAVYAKSVRLIVQDGRLVSASGNDLLPAVDVPSQATGLDVDLQGNLVAIEGSVKASLGRLVLASFPDEASLSTDGGFLIARDRPSLGNPGDDLFGVIRKSTDLSKPPAAKALPPAPRPAALYPKPAFRTPPTPAVGSAPQKINPALPMINVKAESQAPSDRIMLGDVADVSAEPSLHKLLVTTPIGDSPAIGVVRGVDAASIIAGLQRAGFKPGSYVLNVATGARVTRQCQKIDQAKFVEAACQAVQDRLGISAPMVCVIAEPPMACPLGEISLKSEQCNKTPLGAAVTIAVYVDGQRFNSRLIQLSPDKNAVGVRPGEMIKLVLRASGVVVETTAKVRTQAWSGQKVTVETDNGALLDGTLETDGTVEVEL
jgi:hypothetical protein